MYGKLISVVLFASLWALIVVRLSKQGGTESQMWVMGLGGAALTVLAFLAVSQRKERSSAFGKAANRLGMAFRPRADLERLGSFRELPLFRRAVEYGREAYLDVARSDDLWVLTLKCEGFHHPVAAVRLKDASVPAFQASPERLMDKIEAAFGGQDIDFDSDPEFSRRYWLRGVDVSGVRRLFNSSVRRELLWDPGWCLEGEGDWLILYRRDKLIAADELGAFIEDARRWAAMISTRDASSD